MSYQMYQVAMAGVDASPWELLAKSEEHAKLTIRKFYPQARGMDLQVTELTLCGDPITQAHRLKHGESFYTILHTKSGKSAMKGPTHIRGDFDPTRNAYQCFEFNKDTPIYISPYEKVIKKES